jgi:CRP/FNR family transcriptional regulator, cyclic AMP receptor protein
MISPSATADKGETPMAYKTIQTQTLTVAKTDSIKRGFVKHFVDFIAKKGREDLVDQLFNSSEKRLARILLLLAHFGKEGVPQTVIPTISQETLAEMVGTTRSRVSHFMNRSGN